MPIDEDISKIRGVAEDAVTYPILTKEVDVYRGGGSSGDSAALQSGGSATRMAQESIRQVLGWRYRGQDTKGFLAALNRAFDLKTIEGHTEWEWKPQNYMIQADLGEITGAQASILSRAKVIVEHALPLLEGLVPLREDADEDEMEAVRSIIRNALNELLREFGAARGPRVQRVNDYFDQLLGTDPDPNSPETIGGYLGVLRERFGLDRVKVNTIAEEQNLTNGIILVDYVITLYQTWKANRRYFDRSRTAEPFLGTQLVLLSQTLEAVAESVREAYDAMDSVFFSAVERQTTDIDFVSYDKDGKEIPIKVGNQVLFDKTPPRMTITELLGWIEDFASVEARRLIQDAGKDGIVAARRTLRQLRDLSTGARLKSEDGSGNASRGFHSSRVKRALQELETQLKKAYQLAADVRPAVLIGVEPASVRADVDDRTNITLLGEGLSQDGSVFLQGPQNQRVEARSLTVITSRRLLVQFDLTDPKIKTGNWDVVFVPNEGPSVAKDDALTISVPKPVIDSVDGTSERVGQSDRYNMSLTITGQAFRKDAKVTLRKGGADIETKSGRVRDARTIETEFANVQPGKYTVIVTNPDEQVGAREDQYLPPDAPRIDSIAPSRSQPSRNVELTIRGDHFDIAKLLLKGDPEDSATKDLPPINVKATSHTGSDKVVANCNLHNAAKGKWILKLVNKDGLEAEHGFLITDSQGLAREETDERVVENKTEPLEAESSKPEENAQEKNDDNPG